MGCNCDTCNPLQAELDKLKEAFDTLTQRVDSIEESALEDFNSLSERVRDLENITDDGYTVETY